MDHYLTVLHDSPEGFREAASTAKCPTVYSFCIDALIVEIDHAISLGILQIAKRAVCLHFTQELNAQDQAAAKSRSLEAHRLASA